MADGFVTAERLASGILTASKTSWPYIVRVTIFATNTIFLDTALAKPNPLHRAIMSIVLRTIYNSIAWCCSKGPDDRYDPGDEDEVEYRQAGSFLTGGNGAASVDDETAQLLRTSMKDRIEEYQKATAKPKEAGPGSGSAPTPYKRDRSASNVIAQFESMAEESLSSSSHHRRMKTPLLDSSNHRNRTALTTNASAIFQENIRNSVKNLPPCAVCLEAMYPTDPTIQSYGKSMHAACFACQLCHAKLKHHPLEVQFELPENGNALYCVCAKCQLESLHRDKPKVLAKNAGDKITPEVDELGDVKGVKEAIGEELEEILLEKTAPRCQLCAGDFLKYTGHVCVVGQMKYHHECWETGKPSVNLSERQLVPYQAAKYLPERWILRLVMDATNSEDNSRIKRRPIATLFFVWRTRVEDFQNFVSEGQLKATAKIDIQLELDDQALGNPNYHDASRRKTQAPLSSAVNTLECDLIGNPLSTSRWTSTCADKGDQILLRLQVNKYHVQHAVTLCIGKKDAQTLDLTKAQLSIVLQQQE